MPPVTGKPESGIWQPPSSDVLPRPELPLQGETNSNKRNKAKTKQLGISDSIVHATTEGKVEKTNKKSLGDMWNEFWEDLRQGWEHFKKKWGKIGEKRDPDQPSNGYSKRELWINKETGDTMEIHRLKPDPKQHLGFKLLMQHLNLL